MISGKTTLIAHVGYPTFAFKSPMIYNPWFEKNDIDAVVVPMGVKPEEYRELFPLLFKMSNIHGALITMPHKVTTMELVDELTPTAVVAGAANAVLVREDGSLLGDQFDGEGFVRGVLRKGFDLTGKRALVVGNGGVGSPIAASLAAAGVGAMGLFDPNDAASRYRHHIRPHEYVLTEENGIRLLRGPTGGGCAITSRELNARVGGFREDNKRVFWLEDEAYIRDIERLGFGAAVLADLRVHHTGGPHYTKTPKEKADYWQRRQAVQRRKDAVKRVLLRVPFARRVNARFGFFAEPS